MTTQELISKANELGYIIYHIRKRDGEMNISIRQKDRNSYLPPVEFYWDFFTNEQEWKIQTAAFGSLTSDEALKMVQAYQKGIEMAAILNSLSYDDLEEYEAAK